MALREAIAALEKDPRFGSLSRAEKDEARGLIRERYAGNRLKRVIEEERRAQAGGIGRRAAGSVMAAVINVANSATLGQIPNALGAVGADEAALGFRQAVQASNAINPVASGVGSLGGFFGPGSLAGGVAKGAGRLAAKATGASRLVRSTLESGFAARAGAHTLQNLASSAGAITALSLTGAEGGSVQRRLTEAVNNISDPVNFALSASFGGVTARFAKPIQSDLAPAIRMYERVTGKKIPADVALDSAEFKQFISTARTMPGLANTMRQVEKELVSDLGLIVSNIGRRAGVSAGSRSEVRGQAAGAVRKLAGTERKPGLATLRRRSIEGAALEAEGSLTLTPESQSKLIAGLRSVMSGKPRSESRGAFGDVVRKLLKVSSKKDANGRKVSTPISLFELEAIRKQTAKIAFTRNLMDPLDPRLSDRARVEARDFYHVIRETMRNNFPRFTQALGDGEELRKMEKAIGKVDVSQLDDAVVESFFSGSKILERWRALEQNSRPQDVQAVRGWLFHRLVERATNVRSGTLSEVSLARALRGKGAFNSQVIDKILPGVRQEISALARLTGAMKEGVLRAEGSPTATRQGRALAMAAAPAAAAGVVAALLANPLTTIASVLGVGGLKVAVDRSLKSLAAGAANQRLSALATGKPPIGISRLPAAIQSRGPVTQNLSTAIFGSSTGEETR